MQKNNLEGGGVIRCWPQKRTLFKSWIVFSAGIKSWSTKPVAMSRLHHSRYIDKNSVTSVLLLCSWSSFSLSMYSTRATSGQVPYRLLPSPQFVILYFTRNSEKHQLIRLVTRNPRYFMMKNWSSSGKNAMLTQIVNDAEKKVN